MRTYDGPGHEAPWLAENDRDFNQIRGLCTKTKTSWHWVMNEFNFSPRHWKALIFLVALAVANSTTRLSIFLPRRCKSNA